MSTTSNQTPNSARLARSSHDGYLAQLRPAVVSTVVLTLLLGGAYPLVVWAIGRLPGLRDKADGSLIVDKDGTVRGSRLIGQSFAGERYFHPRPSAAGGGYDASLSGGTNWGPTNDKLVAGVADLAAAYRQTNGLPPDQSVPADAVTRSASGLDPHISPANADLQVRRVAAVRGLSEDRVRQLVAAHTDKPGLGILGDVGVNVLTLNLALDHP